MPSSTSSQTDLSLSDAIFALSALFSAEFNCERATGSFLPPHCPFSLSEDIQHEGVTVEPPPRLFVFTAEL
ncbi:unnamed protein product [Pleuronectes platessa]|uniref:Uncharacterized protein n=1 Tax=Pleuronectes platessa TaxID=8262 RepID=A0A9N7Z914_PLEPL|nr:unnamed protein product [Pleuronectes platessa]